MDATVFNPAQQHLLRMMSYIRTPEELAELERLISEYFSKKVDDEMDELWEKGDITEETIEAWGKEHMRTPYNKEEPLDDVYAYRLNSEEEPTDEQLY